MRPEFAFVFTDTRSKSGNGVLFEELHHFTKDKTGQPLHFSYKYRNDPRSGWVVNAVTTYPDDKTIEAAMNEQRQNSFTAMPIPAPDDTKALLDKAPVSPLSILINAATNTNGHKYKKRREDDDEDQSDVENDETEHESGTENDEAEHESDAENDEDEPSDENESITDPETPSGSDRAASFYSSDEESDFA